LVWAVDDPESSTCTSMAGVSYEVGGTAFFDPINISLEEIEVEDVAHLKITAVGGTGVVKYKFFVNKNSFCEYPGNPNWDPLTDWTSNNSCDWKLPEPEDSTLYTLVVWTTDKDFPGAFPGGRPPCVGMGGMTYWVKGSNEGSTVGVNYTEITVSVGCTAP